MLLKDAMFPVVLAGKEKLPYVIFWQLTELTRRKVEKRKVIRALFVCSSQCDENIFGILEYLVHQI